MRLLQSNGRPAVRHPRYAPARGKRLAQLFCRDTGQERRGMRLEPILRALLMGLLVLVSPTLAYSQFTCGSTGADGALVVAAGETVLRDVPDNGKFNFTTIAVSGELKFKPNTKFNPPV